MRVANRRVGALGREAARLIRTALELELQEGTLIADQVSATPCIFLAGLHGRNVPSPNSTCALAPMRADYGGMQPGGFCSR